MSQLVLEKNLKSNFINASKEDLNKLKNTLVRAFIDDPMVNWIVKQDEKVYQRKELMFETIIKHFGFEQGYVHTNEEKTTCAVWMPPKSYQKMSFTGLSLISSWVKTVGIERVLKVMKTSSIISKYHPKVECFYLVALGTAPEAQGKGEASDVIQPVLETCDIKNLPIFLETSNENNLGFYEKHGFKIQNEIIDPEKLPTTWTMLRKPRLAY